jgi:hypothetical protein
MKLEESMAGEDSELEETCSQLAGNTFYDRKNKILMKILEFKRYRIRLIVEFYGIPSDFPTKA